MFNWHIKEKPILSLLGMGGGIGSKLVSGLSLTTSGGNIADGVAPGNGYKYHIFSTPGTFIVAGAPISGEWLMIGGGGGGGSGDAYSGGGGAGGVVYRSVQTFTVGSHPVTIGAAAAPNPSTANPGISPFYPPNVVNTGYTGGQDSVFVVSGTTIKALGGGAGSSRAGPQPSALYTTGSDGGSGGGGGTGYPGGPNPPGPGGDQYQTIQNSGVPNLAQYGNPGVNGGATQNTYGGPGGGAHPSDPQTSFSMGQTPNPSSVLISGSPISAYTFATGGVGHNYPVGTPQAASPTSFGSGGGGQVNGVPHHIGTPGVLIIMYPE